MMYYVLNSKRARGQEDKGGREGVEEKTTCHAGHVRSGYFDRIEEKKSRHGETGPRF